MLDQFVVFSKTGLILWTYQDPKVLQIHGAPINALIREALIEQRVTEDGTFVTGQYAVEYRMHNQFEFLCVAVYKAALQRELAYIGTLVESLKNAFGQKYGKSLQERPFQPFEFEEEFNRLRKSTEARARQDLLAPKAKQMKSFEQTAKFRKSLQHNEELQSGKLAERKKQEQEDAAAAANSTGSTSANDSEADRTERKRREFIQQNKQSGGGNKLKRTPGKMKKEVKGKDVKDPAGGAKAVLDYSNPNDSPNNYGEGSAVVSFDGQEIGEMEAEEVIIPDGEATSSGLFSYFSKFGSGTSITRETLAPVLLQMRDHLITKNVGADIAEKICDGVGESLVGKSKSTFSGVASVVKESMDSTLTNILMPKRRVNILRDVDAKKKLKKPYVICFCGVNGVGKSTNLAKICYWLLQNDNRVLIAACDTFRAGAVEQLRTHVRKLTDTQKQTGKLAEVKLYEKGYGKDPAGIAEEAIIFASQAAFDVVLIDTAGRMQDNEPLMRALAKLVNVNKPDVTLFVGEALVGNEAVDQLSKFNQALADHSDTEAPRGIDGIVLSKFDTVDDKVGAAISMTYITGQPIVFVGTGQTYADLKKLNVNSVVAALLR